MLDTERIAKMIGDIQEYLSKLKELNLRSEEDLTKDWKNLHAAAMLMFSAVNRSIDLAQEIITSRKLGFPGTYAEHFYLLYENKVIDKKLWQELSYLVSARNLIAHEYYRFRVGEMFKAVGVSTEAIPKLVKEVKKLLKE